jgi:hypothetical protein
MKKTYLFGCLVLILGLCSLSAGQQSLPALPVRYAQTLQTLLQNRVDELTKWFSEDKLSIYYLVDPYATEEFVHTIPGVAKVKTLLYKQVPYQSDLDSYLLFFRNTKKFPLKDESKETREMLKRIAQDNIRLLNSLRNLWKKYLHQQFFENKAVASDELCERIVYSFITTYWMPLCKLITEFTKYCNTDLNLNIVPAKQSAAFCPEVVLSYAKTMYPEFLNRTKKIIEQQLKDAIEVVSTRRKKIEQWTNRGDAKPFFFFSVGRVLPIISEFSGTESTWHSPHQLYGSEISKAFRLARAGANQMNSALERFTNLRKWFKTGTENLQFLDSKTIGLFTQFIAELNKLMSQWHLYFEKVITDEEKFAESTNKFYINFEETKNKRGSTMELFARNTVDKMLSNLESFLKTELKESRDLLAQLKDKNMQLKNQIGQIELAATKLSRTVNEYKKTAIPEWIAVMQEDNDSPQSEKPILMEN